MAAVTCNITNGPLTAILGAHPSATNLCEMCRSILKWYANDWFWSRRLTTDIFKTVSTESTMNAFLPKSIRCISVGFWHPLWMDRSM